MFLLARAGVATASGYRKLHPTLADELTERAVKAREDEQEQRSGELEYLANHIAAAIKSIGSLQRQVGALQKTVASRPSL